MKRIIYLWLSLISLLAGCTGVDSSTGSGANLVTEPGEWQLVWSDEFEYSGLPDPTKWNYEEGFLRNKEMQYYTKSRMENSRVENGVLVIEARKENYQNAQYTSASLITLNKESWQYGRMEIRAKLPKGQGVWPAIWTVGINISDVGWPMCGEIDIMEYFGMSPDVITSNVHYYANGERSDPAKFETEKPYEKFHIYAIEWRTDRIDFFFDDKIYHRFFINVAGEGSENPFRKPHYLLINLALGGTSGGIIDDNNLPQQFLIDYVRIYKLVED